MGYLDEGGLSRLWNKILRYVDAKVKTGGLETPISIPHGGTDATTAAGARQNLGLGDGVHLGALGVAYGGTGANTTAGAASALGLGTNNVPTFAGLKLTDPLDVKYGGTGSATHTVNSILTGNGTGDLTDVVTANGAFYATAANGAAQFGTLPIGQGGTGLTTSPSMLTNLASTSADDVIKASPRPGVTGVLPIANGGTGSSTAADARAAIGIGTTDDLTVNSLTATTDIAARSASYNDGVHVYGAIRYNADDEQFEYWNGGAWAKVPAGTDTDCVLYAGSFVKQNLTAADTFTVWTKGDFKSQFNVKDAKISESIDDNTQLCGVSLANGDSAANSRYIIGAQYRKSSGWCMHLDANATAGSAMRITYIVAVPKEVSTI